MAQPPPPVFDDSIPTTGAPVQSEELRTQFTALKYLIDAQAQQIAALQTAVNMLANNGVTLDNSSANTNIVDVMTVDIADPPSQQNVADLRDKVNELINGLRR